MKFKIKTKDLEKAKFFLSRFRDETKEEYEQTMKKVKGRMNLIPMAGNVPIPFYDCDFFVEDDHIIFWNTFQVPDLVKQMGFFNPFKKSVKEMEKNLQGFLTSNGVNCEVKLIE